MLKQKCECNISKPIRISIITVMQHSTLWNQYLLSQFCYAMTSSVLIYHILRSSECVQSVRLYSQGVYPDYPSELKQNLQWNALVQHTIIIP